MNLSADPFFSKGSEYFHYRLPKVYLLLSDKAERETII